MSTEIANQMFLAYLGRPGDATWRASTATVLNGAPPSIALQNAMYSAAVLDGVFSRSDSSSQLVNKIFLNLGLNGGAGASTFEQSAWGQLINSGALTAATAAWTIFSSYLGATNVPASYQQPVQSKLLVIDAFTNQLVNDAGANLAMSSLGSSAGALARTTISSVTSQATAAPLITNIAATVSGVAGATYQLTTGVDTLTGTSNNDVFVADNTGTAKQYAAADTINGGAGTDTLKVLQAAADTPHTLTLSNLTNIENLYLSSGTLTAGQTLDASSVSALTNLTLDTPTAMADGATYTIKLASTAALTLIKALGTAGLATSTIAINGGSGVTLNGVGTDLTLDVASSATSYAIAATGAASAFALANSGANLATLTLTGDKALTITESLSQLKTINAAATTGAVSVDLSGVAQNAAFAFTGGSGNDKLTFAAGALTTANLASGAQIDFGAGTDTLVVKDTAPVVATINAMKGLEILQLGVDAASISMASLISIKTVAVGGFATATVSNVALDSAVNIVGDMSTSVTVVGALGVNSATVNIGAAGAAGVTVASLVTTGLTSVSLASNGTSANTITGIANTENSSFTVTGAQDLTMALTAGAASSGSKIDASNFTGKLAATGTDLADIIIGGSGVDTLIGGKGADKLTGGAGGDIFSFNGASGAANSGVTVFGDEITDFVIGVDKLQFTSVIEVLSAQQTAVQTAVTALAANATGLQIANEMAKANTTDLGMSFAVFQGNTYVYFERTGSNTSATAADDVFIKLTGVTTLPTFTTDVIA